MSENCPSGSCFPQPGAQALGWGSWHRFRIINGVNAWTFQMDSDSDNSDHSVFLYESDDSTTSSIFGFYCELCGGRASGASDLELQYLSDSVYLVDNEVNLWLKCDNCGNCFHKNCWESLGVGPIGASFFCCEYCHWIHVFFLCFIPVWVGKTKKRKGGVKPPRQPSPTMVPRGHGKCHNGLLCSIPPKICRPAQGL